MLDDTTFDVLRRAAAIAHSVPACRLSVRADGDVVLVVGDPLSDHPDVTSCSPCGFRRAVIRATQLHAAGHRLALLGLSGSETLTVEVELGPTGAVVDGDLVLSRICDRMVAVVATTLAPSVVSEALESNGVDASVLAALHDGELGVTLLHLDLSDDRSESAAQLEELARARDACAVEELVVVSTPAQVQ